MTEQESKMLINMTECLDALERRIKAGCITQDDIRMELMEYSYDLKKFMRID